MDPVVADLPPELAERCEVRRGGLPAGGSFVLYWMRSALRGHENPALDVALSLAARLDRPVLVYQGLSERHPFANDRHHTFILEGARDVSAELAERGVAYALHVERDGQRGPHLRELAARAAVVVTEETPVEPLATWTERVVAATDAPCVTVDTSCVLPMRLVDEPHDRAFAFRRKTQKARDARLRRAWHDVAPHARATLADVDVALPFEPVDAASMDVAALVAACAIDHSVGPVGHTRGGSRAGYARWDAFVADGLARYARDRNDPLRDGVSRMSAYLHHGMVSPLRLARQCAERGGAGAEKYLDELLIWREVAHVFCFHHRDVDDLACLPDWAQQTLTAHADDPRPQLFTRDDLARGATGDALWDAAQRSLVAHGELHNNLRMTWGKALVPWTRSPARALELLLDLNHRFALDGRDPASYGGLLWCLGGFDRPFEPERAVTGRLRERTTRRHAERLDVDAYARRVARPSTDERRVAVVGAGVVGLVAARTLVDHGHDVQVFDARDVFGATRHVDGVAFDLVGPIEPTPRGALAARLVESWREDGRLVPSGELLVPAETGDALLDDLARDVDLRLARRVETLRRDAGGWTLAFDDGDETPGFDALVVAVGHDESARLLPAGAPRAAVDATPTGATATVLLARAEPFAADDVVRLDDGGWARRDRRGGPLDAWTVRVGDAGDDEDLARRIVERLGGGAPSDVTRVDRRVDVTRKLVAEEDGLVVALAPDGVVAAIDAGAAAAGRLLGVFTRA